MADFDYLPANFPLPGSGEYREMKVITNSGTLAIGALALNKTSRICRLPAGWVTTGIRFRMGDGDSNGSPTLSIKIGDGTTADQFVAASNVGQAGGEVTALADAAFLTKLAAKTDVILTAATAAATAQAAAFKIAVEGYVAA